jgi:hypothetical protein
MEYIKEMKETLNMKVENVKIDEIIRMGRV